jgi:hypothetical protein
MPARRKKYALDKPACPAPITTTSVSRTFISNDLGRRDISPVWTVTQRRALR